MTDQKWKTDESLYGAPTEVNGEQLNKKLDYDTVYRKEFLDCDPLRDWESIDRCIWLWEWAVNQIIDWDGESIVKTMMDWKVLDIGTKDGQFVEYLVNNSIDGLGIEYSKPYVKYAQDKGRNVEWGDACHLFGMKDGSTDHKTDNTFDFVFSHHVLGLVSDYRKALDEMFRVSKKYMIALNQVPGNPRKHYSYINSPQIFHNFVEDTGCKVIYNDYLDTGFQNEWVIFVKKND
jgi:SAM-dependent methyltransferase